MILTRILPRPLLFTAMLHAVILPVSGDNGDQALSVASLDFCSDQYALALLNRNELASLSRDAIGVESFFREKAIGIPQNKATAEELLALKPTLVVWQWRGNPTLNRILNRAGIKTTVLPFTLTVEDTFDTMMAFGKSLKRQTQAMAFISKRRKMRTALEAAPPLGLKALYLTPSGYTAGAGTEPVNVLTAAGFETMVKAYQLSGWAPLPLEKVVSSAKPDVIVTSFFDLPNGRNNWSLSGHAYIQDMLADLPVINLPARFMACSTLFTIDAAAHIRREAEKIRLTGSRFAPPE